MTEKRLTIRDISRLTGYSRSTVSLVLNNSPKVSGKTREDILKVIRETGYHPSAQARTLAGARPRTVAVVLPPTQKHPVPRSGYCAVLDGITEVAAENGYDLLLEIATPKSIEERKFERIFRSRLVSGMLFIGVFKVDPRIRNIHEMGCPVILINNCDEGIPSIGTDDFGAMRDAVRKLIEWGHRTIAFIGAPPDLLSERRRLEGFRSAISESDPASIISLHRTGDLSQESGYENGLSLLEETPRPTAIVAANDRMAIGVLRAAREKGICVPRDLSILGAGDIEAASCVEPPLSTLSQPTREIARTAMQKLIEFLEKKELISSQVFPGRVILRNSCGPAPGKELFSHSSGRDETS